MSSYLVFLIVLYVIGTVDTYTRTDALASYVRTNTLEGADDDTGFGTAVSLGNENLLVGAPLPGNELAGRAHKYILYGTDWKEQVSYSPSTASSGSNWGIAVSIGSDGRCYVGSSSEGNGQGTNFMVYFDWNEREF